MYPRQAVEEPRAQQHRPHRDADPLHLYLDRLRLPLGFDGKRTAAHVKSNWNAFFASLPAHFQALIQSLPQRYSPVPVRSDARASRANGQVHVRPYSYDVHSLDLCWDKCTFSGQKPAEFTFKRARAHLGRKEPIVPEWPGGEQSTETWRKVWADCTHRALPADDHMQSAVLVFLHHAPAAPQRRYEPGQCPAPGCECPDTAHHGFLSCQFVRKRVWQPALAVYKPWTGMSDGPQMELESMQLVWGWPEGLSIGQRQTRWRLVMWRNAAIVRPATCGRRRFARASRPAGNASWSGPAVPMRIRRSR